eukprot:TRINITY_DN493_c0_g1_i1.p1 TRINITY_DN493_c0_g1~~TRINITY_DN493_c0_g1_i1.p1  ORF type:complete len:431 (+),score=82.73 TRINITY_DN493_c0_g1_i1:239-1531(+)
MEDTNNNEGAIDDGNVENLQGEEKSILLHVISQLRPGMDFSRVTLPVFILESKSFLEKLTDFMTHPALLIGLKLETPLERIRAITRFFMSGFYVRPKGVKKPYTPQLGETFRCHWNHENSKSIYVSEQVSHHPDISAFYGSNRAEGFVVSGSILFRDRFLGNSSSVALEGEGKLHLLEYDEVYTFTFPTVYARGILWGTLLMELSGEIYIKCEKTGYRTDIDFKTKGYFGGEYNKIEGKISHGEVDAKGNWPKKLKTCNTFSGYWDGKITIKGEDKKEEVFWDPHDGQTPKEKMVVRSLDDQSEWDSRKLWLKVTQALHQGDLTVATDEKQVIESKVKAAAAACEESGAPHEPKYFRLDDNGQWVYRWFDLTKWSEEDKEKLTEREVDGVISSCPKSEADAPAAASSAAGEEGKKKKKKSKKKKSSKSSA